MNSMQKAKNIFAGSQSHRLCATAFAVVVIFSIAALSLATCDNGTTSANQTPVAADYDIGNLTQTEGRVTAVTITPKSGKSAGAVTIYYDSSTTLPTTVGEYPVTFDVAAATGWKEASGLSAGTLAINAPSNTIDMVLIPGGTFTMGSPDTEAERWENEGPQRQLTISGFYMGKYEVTQEQYETVMGVNPSNFTTATSEEDGTPGNLPVEYVTWYDAAEFCNKLSVLEELDAVYTITNRTPAAGYPITGAEVTADWGKNGYRLPTEAQWEYACRAGTATAYNTGDTISDDTGWYSDNSGSRTHQVGLKPANAWGLYDMHGNVYEWCWDWYGSYSTGEQTDPVGAASGVYHVVRGGGWSILEQYARSAIRSANDPDKRHSLIGFRVVRP